MKAKIRKLFSNVWTIPNVLTIIRIILIPVFVVLFFKGHKMAALAVFCAASLTDMLDGYLARKLNQITDFGKLFDPLADKLMVLTAMVITHEAERQASLRGALDASRWSENALRFRRESVARVPLVISTQLNVSSSYKNGCI